MVKRGSMLFVHNDKAVIILVEKLDNCPLEIAFF
jgi:hypothetical protein